MRMSFGVGASVVGFVLLAILAFAFLGGCSLSALVQATPIPTMTGLPPTPTSRVLSAIEVAAENQIILAQTQQAEDLIAQRVGERLTATAEVNMARAAQTEQARSDRATQQAIVITATQQKMVMDATATQAGIEAAATERSWNATATISVARNTQEAAQTQAFAPMYGTAEVAGLQAKVTEQLGSAELVKLTVDRQTMKNGLDAYLPWTLIVLAFVVGVLAIVVFSQYRQLKRDGNGLMHGEAIKHSLGTTIIRPDQIPGPGVTVTKAGQVLVHGNAESQAEVTRRAQIREATLGKSIPEFKQVVGMFGAPGTKPLLRVLSPGEAGSLRGDFDAQISAEVVDDD